MEQDGKWGSPAVISWQTPQFQLFMHEIIFTKATEIWTNKQNLDNKNLGQQSHVNLYLDNRGIDSLWLWYHFPWVIMVPYVESPLVLMVSALENVSWRQASTFSPSWVPLPETGSCINLWEACKNWQSWTIWGQLGMTREGRASSCQCTKFDSDSLYLPEEMPQQRDI